MIPIIAERTMSNLITQRKIREFESGFKASSRVVLGLLSYLALSCGREEFMAAAAVWATIEFIVFAD